MVKITVEPVRLQQLLKQSLAYGKSAITEKSIIKFTPDKVLVPCLLASDAIILAEYDKTFFNSIECTEEELFMTTLTLVKNRLSHGFNGEKVTFTTDKEYVTVTGEGTDDTIKEKLDEIVEEKIAAMNGKLLHWAITQVGIIPYTDPEETKFMPFDLQAMVEVARFSDLPEYEYVNFVFDGKTLTMKLSDQLGNRTRPLPIKNHAKENKIVEGLTIGEDKGPKFDYRYNMKLVTQLVSQFEGDVWLSFNNGMLIIGQKNKDYSVSYIAAISQ